jgi:hypothetical protein
MNVFLSYARADQELASQVESTLRSCGFDTWSADRELRVGEMWSDVIARALRRADAFVVLLTRKYSQSEWGRVELGTAIASGKPVIPILAEKGADVPSLLRGIIYLDLTDGRDKASQLASLCEILSRGLPPPSRQAGIEAVQQASDALREERAAYESDAGLQRSSRARLEGLAAAVAVIGGIAGLLTSSLAGTGTEVIAATVAAAGAALAAAGGFYLGSKRRRDSP